MGLNLLVADNNKETSEAVTGARQTGTEGHSRDWFDLTFLTPGAWKKDYQCPFLETTHTASCLVEAGEHTDGSANRTLLYVAALLTG